MSLQTDVTTPAVKGNPYVGPQAFRRGDQLYGRDRAAADLLDLLVAERIVLLHSPSGAGKTSLIQARMLGLLEDENFHVLPVVRLNHEVPDEIAQKGRSVNRYVLSALLSLEEALPTDAQKPVTTLADLTLADYVAQRPKGGGHPANAVLVLDQFEEVITADPVDQDAKTAFFLQLGALLRDRSLWCLFSMREDFLAELDPYARHVPTRFMNRYRLDLLARDEALDAMVYPARDAGVDFDPVAAGKLVDDLRTVRVQRGSTVVEELGPYVEPVQLQVVCRGMWDRLKGDASRIELSDVEAVGDVDQALASYYAECVASAAEAAGVPERAVRDWCGDELITPQGFRGQAMHGPLAAGDAGERVLTLLTSAHLLRAESRRGAVWYELAHDRLIDPIKEDNEIWKAKHLSDLERRATLWEEQSRSDGLLLTGAELSHAETWVASRSQRLTDVEQDFLAASGHARDEARKEARANARIRRWLIVAVLGLVLALVASGFAVNSSIQAGEATLRASEAAILGQSLANLSDDPQLSLRLAIKATTLREKEGDDVTGEAMNALQLAVDASPVIHVLRGSDSGAFWATYSRNGRRIVSAHHDGKLRVWDTRTGKAVWSLEVGQVSEIRDGEVPFAISPDGARVAVFSQGVLRVWGVGSSIQPRVLMKDKLIYMLSFSPDGRWIVCTRDGPPVVVDTTSGSTVRMMSAPVGQQLFWSGQGGWAPTGAQLVGPTKGGQQLLLWKGPSAAPKVVPLQKSGTVVVSPRGGIVAIQEERSVTAYADFGLRELNTVTLGSVNAVEDVSLSGDGSRMAVVGVEGDVSIYDTRTGDLLRRVSSGSSREAWIPVRLDPAAPNRALVVASDGRLTIWDVTAGTPDGENVIAFGVTKRGQGMTVTQRGRLRVWSGDGQETESMDLVKRLGLEAPANSPAVVAADLSPSGTLVAVSTGTGGAYVVPLDRGKKPLRLTVDNATPAVTSVAVSPSGRFVAGAYPAYPLAEPTGGLRRAGGGGVPAGIYIWDVTTGKPIHRLQSTTGQVGLAAVAHFPLGGGEGTGGAPFALQFSPRENALVGLVADASSEIRAVVWELDTGKVRLELLPGASSAQSTPSRLTGGGDGGQPESFSAVTWSPDGSLLATALDKRIQLWDASNGRPARPDLVGHRAYVSDLAFDATGDRLVSYSQDEVVMVWNVRTRAPVRTINPRQVLDGINFITSNRLLVLREKEDIPSAVWLDGKELLAIAKARVTHALTFEECMPYLDDERICSSD